MIDSHTHLYDPAYDGDREDVIRRAREAGVEVMIAVGCDLETSRRALELAESHEGIYATLGVHPHEVKSATDAAYAELEAMARNPKVVGIGETGLDYYYKHSPVDIQRDHFRRQIGLARRLGLPLVIHSRDAKEDTLAILREEQAEQAGGVLHCFTGDLEMAEAALDLGFYISFSGILTFSNAKPLREVAGALPLDRILVETDCPYLAPIPHRGKRNEPAYLRKTIETLMELKEQPARSEMGRITAENTARLFKIKF
ncbi:MAG TPA: TatD family hydrolase [Nitrospiria bacterium]